MTADVAVSSKLLTAEEIDAYHRDGVVCVRQLYSPDWVRRIERFIDDIVSKPSPVFGPRPEGAKFIMDMNTWLTHDDVRDFVLYGPSARLAQSAFGSDRVTFYYDQIFVKKELTPEPTPWHHDFTFWPLAGTQIASLWTSVDPVDAASSGLEFVAGSHLWPQRYRAIGHDGTDYTTGADMEELPDIEADREKYRILSWDMEPGDAVLFHALTLHGSRGNSSRTMKRRAITTRWCGDDVTFDSRHDEGLYAHGLRAGDPFSSWLYPQILPTLIEEQIAPRLAGPILPDPARIGAAIQRLGELDRLDIPLDENVPLDVT